MSEPMILPADDEPVFWMAKDADGIPGVWTGSPHWPTEVAFLSRGRWHLDPMTAEDLRRVSAVISEWEREQAS